MRAPRLRAWFTNLHLSSLLLLGITVALPCAAAAQTDAHAQPMPVVYPGEVVKVRLTTAPARAELKARFGLRRVITVFDPNAKAWFALTGMSLRQVPGEYIISYRTPRGPVANRTFLVKPAQPMPHPHDAAIANNGASRNDANDDDAPVTDTTRRWWEAPAVQKAVAQFDDAVAPQMRFVAPLKAPVLMPFGAWVGAAQSPLEYSIELHFGRAPEEDMARSPARGRIVMQLHEHGCDPGLLIDHGSGLYSVLCGLREILAEEGAHVARREPLASLDTEAATPATLRWAVMMNRNWINPLSLVNPPR